MTKFAALTARIADINSYLDNVGAQLHEARNAIYGDEHFMDTMIRTLEAEYSTYCGALALAYEERAALPADDMRQFNLDEDARIEALAERAQHEDDLRAEIEARAAAEHARKNRGMTIAEARNAHDNIPAGKRNNNCVQDAQWRLRDALKLADSVGPAAAPSYVVKAVRDLQSWLK